MTFQPGHPGYPSQQKTTNATKRALKNLALSIREGVHPDEIRDWLVSVWKGRDPATGEAVDLKNRAAALQMLLDRGWGQAAQHVIVEADIRTEMMLQAPKDSRPPMTLEQINERRAKLRELGVKPKIIDAESVPKLELASGSETDEE